MTYDTSSDQPEKATLQTALRLFVNTMRKGQLVRRHVVVQLREALQAAGWNGKSERGSWRQEDASELLLFLTEAFDLPYLPVSFIFRGVRMVMHTSVDSLYYMFIVPNAVIPWSQKGRG